METESQFEMSVNGHQTTRRHIPEHGNLHIHRRHILKFSVSLVTFNGSTRGDNFLSRTLKVMCM